MRFNLLKYVSNAMIGLSVLGLLFTYLPLGYYLISKATFESNISLDVSSLKPNSLYIPGINAYADISWGIDPWKYDSYSSSLEKGVAHAKGTVLPGEPGTSYIFAHSSLPPWKLTRVNTPFLFLDNVKNGERIYVNREGTLYVYEVFEKKSVWPNEVTYLKDGKEGTDLILQTCAPLGTALKRLLVFAKRVV